MDCDICGKRLASAWRVSGKCRGCYDRSRKQDAVLRQLGIDVL